MQEVKSPKKPLLYYYGVVLLVGKLAVHLLRWLFSLF